MEVIAPLRLEENCLAYLDQKTKQWHKSGKYIPAEALDRIQWNDVNSCVDRYAHREIQEDVRQSCYRLYSKMAKSLIKDILNWMHDCATYISTSKAVATVVNHYTSGQNPYISVPAHQLLRWYGEGMPIRPNENQEKLYSIIMNSPRFLAPISNDPSMHHEAPYVYLYRGINYSKALQRSRYLSPDCSSWTLSKDVAKKFGKGGGILRIKFTGDLAGLNLHCLPFKGFAGEDVCTRQAFDPRSPLAIDDRAVQALQKQLFSYGEQGPVVHAPATMGHISDYLNPENAEYEVIVQPFILEQLRPLNKSFEGLPMFEGDVYPLERVGSRFIQKTLKQNQPLSSEQSVSVCDLVTGHCFRQMPSAATQRPVSPRTQRLAKAIDQRSTVIARQSKDAADHATVLHAPVQQFMT